MNLVSLALLAFLPAAAGDEPRFEYRLSMPKPTTHLYHLTLTVKDLPGKNFDLVMPVWTPGSYKVRDYVRFVQKMKSTEARIEKIDKTTWRVHHLGARSVTIRYRVFAHEMSVRTSHLDSEHGTVIGAATFFYVKGYGDRPWFLEVDPFPGWRVATGLEVIGENRFRAADFDTLVDCPLEIADFREISFSVNGVPHRVVISGPVAVPLEKIRDDFRKIVRETTAVFGSIPYRAYTFLVRSLPGGGGGGLEHMNSTLMDVSTLGLVSDDGYRRFLGLAAHEFFHTWLVKRIRPRSLGPLNYTRENYTRMLWAMEGITSYYTPVILSRAGLTTRKVALASLAKTMTSLASRPGRKGESPEMASFNAWIHQYQPGPDSVNTTASYYSTGKMIGWALDLAIRALSGKSLDDVLRALFKISATGITPEMFQEECEKVAGRSLSRFFAKCVRGTRDPDPRGGLREVGLVLEDEGTSAPWLGVIFEEGRISSVLEKGPGWEGGLCVGDELLAVEGFKANAKNWSDWVGDRAEGALFRITVFRRGILKEVDVPFRSRKRPDYRIRKADDATPEQEKALNAWLGG